MAITPEQREARRSGVFSSDAARLMMGDGHRLWAEKVGTAEPRDISGEPHVQLGNLLEPLILDAYRRDTGNVIMASPDTMRRRDVSWAGAHLDAWDFTDRVIVEVKTTNQHSARLEWGEPGTDQVPERVVWQAHHQMWVATAPAGFDLYRADDPVRVRVLLTVVDERTLIAYATGRPIPYVVYEVPKGDGVMSAMAECEADFWRHVCAGEPLTHPPRPGETAIIYPNSSQKSAVADGVALSAWEQAVSCAREASEASALYEALTEQLRAHMRDAEILRSNDGQIIATWKSSRPPKVFDLQRFAEDHPDLCAQYMKAGKSSRRFVLKQPQPKEQESTA